MTWHPPSAAGLDYAVNLLGFDPHIFDRQRDMDGRPKGRHFSDYGESGKARVQVWSYLRAVNGWAWLSIGEMTQTDATTIYVTLKKRGLSSKAAIDKVRAGLVERFGPIEERGQVSTPAKLAWLSAHAADPDYMNYRQMAVRFGVAPETVAAALKATGRRPENRHGMAHGYGRAIIKHIATMLRVPYDAHIEYTLKVVNVEHLYDGGVRSVNCGNEQKRSFGRMAG